MQETADFFLKLLEIIKKLRGPQGCPWDQKQTPDDVKQYLTEELYEVLEAIDSRDKKQVLEECGDLLFMLLFLINLYQENGYFTIDDVLSRVGKKMIHRHPHVFDNVKASTVEQVKENWQRLKQGEGKSTRNSILDYIPKGLPALYHAFCITQKASDVGFDWGNAGEAFQKVKEEIQELERAIIENKQKNTEEEIGDLFFSIVNVCRHLHINPEQALRKCNNKFSERFHYIERTLREQNRQMKHTNLKELDNLWDKAKDKDRKGKK